MLHRFSYGRAYSPLDFVELRAALYRFLMLLLGVSQEVAKKETRTFPPGPPGIRRLNSRRRVVRVAKFLHLRGIYSTPQMGLLLARILLPRFYLKFAQTWV